MRQANLSQNSWLALAVIAAMAFIVVAVVLNRQATVAFTTIDVPSGIDPEANVQDTLTFEAGINMTIEGTGNDTVTFSSPTSAEGVENLNIADPTAAGSTNLAQFEVATGVTLTEVACSSDSGSVTIQLDERTRSTPNSSGTDLLTSSLVCDTTGAATTSFAQAAIAAETPVNVQILNVVDTPEMLRLHVHFTE